MIAWLPKLAFSLLALASAAAWAQAPVIIQSDPLPQPAPPPGTPAPLEAPLAIRTLSAPDPASVGLIDQSRPEDFWKGADRGLTDLFATLPQPSPLYVTQGLARRLLAGMALAPAAAARGDGPSFMTLRVGGLVAMGELGMARALNDLVDPARRPADMRRPMLDVLLIEGRLDEACALARAALQQDDAVQWQKAHLLCLIRANQTAEAQLALSLLREQSIDSAFVTLANLALRPAPPARAPVAVPTFTAVDPLVWAIARHLKFPITATMANAFTNPALHRALMQAEDAPFDLRLMAAFRAELAGLVSIDQIARDLLPRAKTEFFDRQRTPRPGDLSASNAVRLFYAAHLERDEARKAQIVAQLLDWGRQTGLYPVMARLSALRLDEPGGTNGALLDFTPALPDYDASAPQLLSAMLAAGSYDSVLFWWRGWINRAGNNDTAATVLRARAWPAAFIANRLTNLSANPERLPPREMVRLAPTGEARVFATDAALYPASLSWRAEDFQAWVQVQRTVHAQQADRRILMMTGLMRALGFEPQGLNPLDRPASALPPRLGLLRQAGEEKQPGLVLLGLQHAFEGKRLDALDPETTALAVQALRQAGYEVEAWALAADIVAAYGL